MKPHQIFGFYDLGFHYISTNSVLHLHKTMYASFVYKIEEVLFILNCDKNLHHKCFTTLHKVMHMYQLIHSNVSNGQYRCE
jgi:hypothetical protein